MTMTIDVDKNLLDDTKKVFQEYGISINEAVTLFLTKVKKDKNLPFEKKPTKRLQEAIAQADKKEGVFYDSIEELMKDLKS